MKQQLKFLTKASLALVSAAAFTLAPTLTHAQDYPTKPVRIIVCGGNGYVNPAYLYIAWKTGGSVHTLEKDIQDMSKLQEGSILEIGEKRYLLSGGKFKPINRL